MFSGIVEGMKPVVSVEPDGGARALAIDLGDLASGLRPGDSVAVDGCCLTVERFSGTVASFRVVRETLERTTIGGVAPGATVNVERSLRVGDQLGGHLVTGHVDGVAAIVDKRAGTDQTWMTVALPGDLAALVIHKGSIALDGVSLTVAREEGPRVSVALVPHTLAHTTLGAKGAGASVNVECDQIGKWVRKLLPGASS